MLIWVCALHCEAKPIIDFYRLKKSTTQTDFDLYRNDAMSCIVSGMGAQRMTQAITWAASLFYAGEGLRWINIGIAGHKNLDIGSAIIVSKFHQHHNPTSITVQQSVQHAFKSMPVTSHSAEQTDYEERSLFDMEAYAFIQAARRLSPAKWCQSIKIISDNQHNPPSRNKARISQLIADNMPAISGYASQLVADGPEPEVTA